MTSYYTGFKYILYPQSLKNSTEVSNFVKQIIMEKNTFSFVYLNTKPISFVLTHWSSLTLFCKLQQRKKGKRFELVESYSYADCG